MKNLIYILLIFLSGCFVEKNMKKHQNNKHVFKNVVYDSVSNPKTVLTSKNLDPPVKDYLIIERSDGLPESNLKIVEVKNTKVINRSSDFAEGRVIYKIPETMKIRGMYKVIVRICKSRYTVSVYDNLVGTIRTSHIPVSEIMDVRLIDLSPTDRKAFNIIGNNNSVQIIDNGDTYTEWGWYVTPIRVGKSKLGIIISVVRNGNKKDVVYEDFVEVERDAKEQIIFFLEEQWKWVITTFAIPLLVWLYKRRKENKLK